MKTTLDSAAVAAQVRASLARDVSKKRVKAAVLRAEAQAIEAAAEAMEAVLFKLEEEETAPPIPVAQAPAPAAAAQAPAEVLLAQPGAQPATDAAAEYRDLAISSRREAQELRAALEDLQRQVGELRQDASEIAELRRDRDLAVKAHQTALRTMEAMEQEITILRASRSEGGGEDEDEEPRPVASVIPGATASSWSAWGATCVPKANTPSRYRRDVEWLVETELDQHDRQLDDLRESERAAALAGLGAALEQLEQLRLQEQDRQLDALVDKGPAPPSAPAEALVLWRPASLGTNTTIHARPRHGNKTLCGAAPKEGGLGWVDLPPHRGLTCQRCKRAVGSSAPMPAPSTPVDPRQGGLPAIA